MVLSWFFLEPLEKKAKANGGKIWQIDLSKNGEVAI